MEPTRILMGGHPVTLHPPVKHLKGYSVRMEGEGGESEDRVFKSRALAEDWFSVAVTGRSTVKPVWSDTEFQGHAKGSKLEVTDVAGAYRSRKRVSVNLRSVAEVLDEYGLNPFEEIAKALTKTKPVTDRNGDPVLDPDTMMQMHEPVLDEGTRAKVALELAQYVKPKLKSIEMKVEDARQMSEDEVDAKIAKLMARAAARKDGGK